MSYETTIDMREAEARANEAKDLLQTLRTKYDLARYEFTRAVRIAPFEEPHSHPVLTIVPAIDRDEQMFIATYVKQQVKRYLLDHRSLQVDQALERLAGQYPHHPAPDQPWSEGLSDLHFDLIVCLLELNVISDLFGDDIARKRVEATGGRRWCYREAWFRKTVLTKMLGKLGITPMPDARTMVALAPAA